MGDHYCAHTYFHHQYNGVEGNQCHDEVLKLLRLHQLPDLVLDGVFVLWHEPTHWLGIDSEVNALFL